MYKSLTIEAAGTNQNLRYTIYLYNGAVPHGFLSLGVAERQPCTWQPLSNSSSGNEWVQKLVPALWQDSGYTHIHYSSIVRKFHTQLKMAASNLVLYLTLSHVPKRVEMHGTCTIICVRGQNTTLKL